jgi:GNAT superfamily N-acetyltransferase
VNPALELSQELDPSDADRQVLLSGLTAFNEAHAPASDATSLTFFLRDAAGVIRGGLLAEAAWAWLHIRIVWVAEDCRGRGCGRRLVEAAEGVARERGCRGAHLSTFEFQARAFYQRLGYGIFGVLEDCPPGSARYYMRKTWIWAGTVESCSIPVRLRGASTPVVTARRERVGQVMAATPRS